MTPDDDLGVWKWAVAVALSVLSGLIGGVWVSRGVLSALENIDADHEKRIHTLEQQKKDQADFCDKRKNELLAELTKEICSIVKISIQEITIENNAKLAAISINQALQGQILGQIQADVEAIFGRMNRRSLDREQSGDSRRPE
jgi:hypothetical protein